MINKRLLKRRKKWKGKDGQRGKFTFFISTIEARKEDIHTTTESDNKDRPSAHRSGKR